MNENLAEIVCIVDRSGSMGAIRDDAIGGFNTFLEDQKQTPGDANLTLILFNHAYEVVHNGIPLANVPPLDVKSYVPSGSTALLDAVGRTIDEVGARLAAIPEAERPGKVLVAILTDGMENASTDYTRAGVAERIQHQQEKYSWEFFFLGANVDAFAEASSLNIPAANAVNYAATGAGVRLAFSTSSSFLRKARERKS